MKDPQTQAMRKVARKAEAVKRAELELEEAVVEASGTGLALRPIAYQAGMSHESVRAVLTRAAGRAAA